MGSFLPLYLLRFVALFLTASTDANGWLFCLAGFNCKGCWEHSTENSNVSVAEAAGLKNFQFPYRWHCWLQNLELDLEPLGLETCACWDSSLKSIAFNQGQKLQMIGWQFKCLSCNSHWSPDILKLQPWRQTWHTDNKLCSTFETSARTWTVLSVGRPSSASSKLRPTFKTISKFMEIRLPSAVWNTNGVSSVRDRTNSYLSR